MLKSQGKGDFQQSNLIDLCLNCRIARKKCLSADNRRRIFIEQQEEILNSQKSLTTDSNTLYKSYTPMKAPRIGKFSRKKNRKSFD